MTSKQRWQDDCSSTSGHIPTQVRPAPEYRPNSTEFADPARYIASIALEASQFGICKIIPPKSWKPPFCLQKGNLRIHTKEQVLSQLSGQWRIWQSFLQRMHQLLALEGYDEEDAESFLNENGNAGKLYRLWRQSRAIGAKDGGKLTQSQWSQLAHSSKIGGVPQAKLAFERFFKKLNAQASESAQKSRKRKARQSFEETDGYKTENATTVNAAEGLSSLLETADAAKRQLTGAEASAAVNCSKASLSLALIGCQHNCADIHDIPHASSSALDAEKIMETTYCFPSAVAVHSDSDSDSEHSKGSTVAVNGEALKTEDVLSNKEADYQSVYCNEAGHAASIFSEQYGQTQMPDLNLEVEEIHSDASTLQDLHDRESIEQLDEILACQDCGRQLENVALSHVVHCSACKANFHLRCVRLQPPVPVDWVCEVCQSLDAEESFGFIEGRRYTLNSFRKMAQSSRFHQFGKRSPSISEIEKMYWLGVAGRFNDEIAVEYGSEVDTSQYGSGFPTAPASDKYVKSMWNTNNLACMPGSMLRYLPESISGVTVPWLYIGMCMSSFCWHTEDLYMYSINYLHTGDTKLWYGAPGSAGDKFDSAVQSMLPELFDVNKDLLCRLVTMIHPDDLAARGVPICRLEQNEGDIVITFPRAYHGGFNTGFNVAESCNFALHDWLPMGAMAVKNYEEMSRQAVFCFEALLLRIAILEKSVVINQWLFPCLENIVLRLKENVYQSNVDRIPIRYMKNKWVAEDSSDQTAGATLKRFGIDSHVDGRPCHVCNRLMHCAWFEDMNENVHIQQGTFAVAGTAKVWCAEHALEECGKPELVINVPIEEADILLKEVGRRANAHMEWIATVNAHLDQRTELKVLKSLLQECDKQYKHLPEVEETRHVLMDRIIAAERVQKDAVSHLASCRSGTRAVDQKGCKKPLKDFEGILERMHSIQVGLDEIHLIERVVCTCKELQEQAKSALKSIPWSSRDSISELVSSNSLTIPNFDVESLESQLNPKLYFEESFHIYLVRDVWSCEQICQVHESLARLNDEITQTGVILPCGEIISSAVAELLWIRQVIFTLTAGPKPKHDVFCDLVDQGSAHSLWKGSAAIGRPVKTLLDSMLHWRKLQDSWEDRVRKWQNDQHPSLAHARQLRNDGIEFAFVPLSLPKLSKLIQEAEHWADRAKAAAEEFPDDLSMLMRLEEEGKSLRIKVPDVPSLRAALKRLRDTMKDVKHCSTICKCVAFPFPRTDRNQPSSEEVFCVCRGLNQDVNCIQCDECDEWYHLQCLNIAKSFADKAKSFECSECCLRLGKEYKGPLLPASLPKRYGKLPRLVVAEQVLGISAAECQKRFSVKCVTNASDLVNLKSLDKNQDMSRIAIGLSRAQDWLDECHTTLSGILRSGGRGWVQEGKENHLTILRLLVLANRGLSYGIDLADRIQLVTAALWAVQVRCVITKYMDSKKKQLLSQSVAYDTQLRSLSQLLPFATSPLAGLREQCVSKGVADRWRSCLDESYRMVVESLRRPQPLWLAFSPLPVLLACRTHAMKMGKDPSLDSLAHVLRNADELQAAINDSHNSAIQLAMSEADKCNVSVMLRGPEDIKTGTREQSTVTVDAQSSDKEASSHGCHEINGEPECPWWLVEPGVDLSGLKSELKQLVNDAQKSELCSGELVWEVKRSYGEPDSEDEGEGVKIYCVCRGPDDGTAMTECDGCRNWFHDRCMQFQSGPSPKTKQQQFCIICFQAAREKYLQEAKLMQSSDDCTGSKRGYAGGRGRGKGKGKKRKIT